MLVANAIAENMFDQVDGKVNRNKLLQEFVDHRYNGTEVKEQDAFIKTCSETKSCRETKKGVEVLVQWKDRSTTCVTLKDMKNSYSVQMAEYVVQCRITGDPAFAWWIGHVLEKRTASLES